MNAVLTIKSEYAAEVTYPQHGTRRIYRRTARGISCEHVGRNGSHTMEFDGIRAERLIVDADECVRDWLRALPAKREARHA